MLEWASFIPKSFGATGITDNLKSIINSDTDTDKKQKDTGSQVSDKGFLSSMSDLDGVLNNFDLFGLGSKGGSGSGSSLLSAIPGADSLLGKLDIPGLGSDEKSGSKGNFLSSIPILGGLLDKLNPSETDSTKDTKESKKSKSKDKHKKEDSSIKKFATVDEGLYRGAKITTDEQAEELKKRGVTTVIDLRDNEKNVEKERKLLEKHGIKLVNIPMNATKPPTQEQISQFMDVIKNNDGGVYFHCRQGEDRTGTMAAVYRMEKDGWSNQEAFQEMKDMGHGGFKQLLFPALKDFVMDYKPQGY